MPNPYHHHLLILNHFKLYFIIYLNLMDFNYLAFYFINIKKK